MRSFSYISCKKKLTTRKKIDTFLFLSPRRNSSRLARATRWTALRRVLRSWPIRANRPTHYMHYRVYIYKCSAPKAAELERSAINLLLCVKLLSTTQTVWKKIRHVRHLSDLDISYTRTAYIYIKYSTIWNIRYIIWYASNPEICMAENNCVVKKKKKQIKCYHHHSLILLIEDAIAAFPSTGAYYVAYMWWYISESGRTPQHARYQHTGTSYIRRMKLITAWV